MDILTLLLGVALGLLVGYLLARVRVGAIEAKAKADADLHVQTLQQLEQQRLQDVSRLEGQRQQDAQRAQQQLDEARAAFDERCRSIEAYGQKLLHAKEAEHKAIVEGQEQRHAEALQGQEKRHSEALQSQARRHEEALESMRQTFAQTIEGLKTHMKAATEDMLRSRQEEFSALSQQNIKGIVDPLNETIARMREAMEGYSKEQSAFGGAMKANIEAIIQQAETTRQSAIELTTALKHDTQLQGSYGEAILDEMLSKQGFTRGIHYELQYVIRDENGRALRDDEGQGLRPDVLFHIDTVRDVIIDSKINLTDFISFANAQTPEERNTYLERHVRSVERQVQLLSQKNYFKYHKKTGARMDYVIMFVPISAAWWEALRYKPSLWREAMDKNVYIADEQTLFAALRIIKLTWTQIAQVDSQKEVFDLVNEMIDRVGQFMKSYAAIGAALKTAQEAYLKGEEKLTPGGQSILTTTSKLLKKGAQDSKKNPVSKFLDVDDIPPIGDLPSSNDANG